MSNTARIIDEAGERREDLIRAIKATVPAASDLVDRLDDALEHLRQTTSPEDAKEGPKRSPHHTTRYTTPSYEGIDTVQLIDDDLPQPQDLTIELVARCATDGTWSVTVDRQGGDGFAWTGGPDIDTVLRSALPYIASLCESDPVRA